ncbi:UDP-N-acetylmuramoyl-tripeptide--D-alanyl-D-alanine ligase [Nitrosomonas sp. PY1]|uniref:UDP-N-acetylmuramoyl-tripeptide--D-alanyl-D- alanine ligase n=1 Tax=Nitrosomonas sp. PY1 TaxID=1803906 RepID=UPI001FC8CEF0|nr:UDP-N-acetylmuramoyl-tripeptide--D-alanyl-D-alanine ligase [Nitrosomonas sp. PY1]GKS68128.1 UDP-N-acetylmuramoyl-tripeptide--D-alanyl-D-alanine ligase [Nitrosomonas sp. PY1]
MMTIKQAAAVLRLDWLERDVFFTGISTDSRTSKSGDLFIALSGKNFEGGKFVSNAIKQGAVAAIINENVTLDQPVSNIPILKVKDTRCSLGQLAAFWRDQFKLPVIGITGSNGKTTAKEMVAAILRKATWIKENSIDQPNDHVLATEGNLNNDIGVPLMLLRLRQYHQFAVFEMGMNHIGEIAYLTQLVKPDVALITNAGNAHIEGLGSIEAVARAKAEIFQGLRHQGTAIINADDAYAPLWRDCASSYSMIDFGLHQPAQINATYQMNALISQMQLKLPDGEVTVHLQVPGVHNIYNALAAAATAVALRVDKMQIAAGLESFTGVKGRIQKKRGLHNTLLLDDTYNANPDSVSAALAVLAASSGKKILVLGDMGELGDSAIRLHQKIGQDARNAGLDRLLTLGNLSAYTTEEFGKGAQHFNSIDDLLNAANSLLASDATFLIKGSRFMQMERVVQRLEIPSA